MYILEGGFGEYVHLKRRGREICTSWSGGLTNMYILSRTPGEYVDFEAGVWGIRRFWSRVRGDM